jgi:hypothetical protein
MTGETRTGHGIEQEQEGMDPERRAALLAIARYSGAVGTAATLTVLSAEEAVAKQPCSTKPGDATPGQNCIPSNSSASSYRSDTRLIGTREHNVFEGQNSGD